MKLKFVKGRGYETYNTKEVKKEHKEEAKADEEAEQEEEAPVLLLTYVNNILHLNFPMFRCTSKISKFTIQMVSMRTSLTFPTFSREPSPNTRELRSVTGTTIKKFFMKLWKRLCLNLFFTRRMKMLSTPDGFMLYGQFVVDFFSTSKLLHPKMKIRLRLIRPGPKFT